MTLLAETRGQRNSNEQAFNRFPRDHACQNRGEMALFPPPPFSSRERMYSIAQAFAEIAAVIWILSSGSLGLVKANSRNGPRKGAPALRVLQEFWAQGP